MSTVIPLSTGNNFVKITGTSIAQNRTVFILLHLSATTDTFATPFPKNVLSPGLQRGHVFLTFLLLCVPTQLCWLLPFLSSSTEVVQDSVFFFSLYSASLGGLIQSSSVCKCHTYYCDTQICVSSPEFSPELQIPPSSSIECLLGTSVLMCSKLNS